MCSSSEISVTVSGPPRITGFAEVYISKTILPTLIGFIVELDGKKLNFTVSLLDDS